MCAEVEERAAEGVRRGVPVLIEKAGGEATRVSVAVYAVASRPACPLPPSSQYSHYLLSVDSRASAAVEPPKFWGLSAEQARAHKCALRNAYCELRVSSS